MGRYFYKPTGRRRIKRRLLTFWKLTHEVEIQELYWPKRLAWWTVERMMNCGCIYHKDKILISDNLDSNPVQPG